MKILLSVGLIVGLVVGTVIYREVKETQDSYQITIGIAEKNTEGWRQLSLKNSTNHHPVIVTQTNPVN